MLVLQLKQEDVPAAIDLMSGDDLLDLLHVGIRNGEHGTHLPLHHPGLDADPRRVASLLPLGTGIGAGAHEGVHPEFLQGG